MTVKTSSLVVVCSLALGCTQREASSSPTPAAAKRFLDTANETVLKLGTDQGRAGWVQQTFITDDTEVIAAQASQAANDAGGRLAKASTTFARVDVPPDQRPHLTLLHTSLTLAPHSR